MSRDSSTGLEKIEVSTRLASDDIPVVETDMFASDRFRVIVNAETIWDQSADDVVAAGRLAKAEADTRDLVEDSIRQKRCANLEAARAASLGSEIERLGVTLAAVAYVRDDLRRHADLNRPRTPASADAFLEAADAIDPALGRPPRSCSPPGRQRA